MKGWTEGQMMNGRTEGKKWMHEGMEGYTVRDTEVVVLIRLLT